MASEKITAIVESVKTMTVLELKELVDTICEEFGVSAVAAAAPAAAAAAAPAEEEKTEFDVILKEVGANKMQVIKAVKELTGVSLMEAKKLVETPEAKLKEQAPKAEAEEMQKKLEEVGAKIELPSLRPPALALVLGRGRAQRRRAAPGNSRKTAPDRRMGLPFGPARLRGARIGIIGSAPARTPR